MKRPKRCIFCEIAAGRAKSHKLYEDELSLVILDINPFARGHCLVIPKRHVPWWHDLSEKETESLFKAARLVARKMVRQFKCDFVCIYARGRRIPHTHIFLVPTTGGDLLDRFFNTLEKVQESPPELVQLRQSSALRQTARKLRIKRKAGK